MDITEKIEKFLERVEESNPDEPFLYEGAGSDAPPGVQEAIEKFRNLPEEERGDVPLLYWLLGSGTPPYKVSQEDAEYTDQAPGEQKCMNCKYAYKEVRSGEYICSHIRGKIKLEGWCNRWKSAQDE